MKILKMLEKKDPVVRAGRRSTDPQIVTSRLPAWAVLLMTMLFALVIVLGSMIVRTRSGDEAQASPSYAVIKTLEGELAERPNDPKLLLQLGFEYRKAGMLDDALRVNRRVADMDPNDTASRYHVGSILRSMGDDREAEVAFWNVLEVEPTHAMAAKALGEIYAARGQYKSLLVSIEPAAVEHPEVADLQYLWGLGKEKTGDSAGARRAYWLATQQDPNLAAARAAYDRLKLDVQ